MKKVIIGLVALGAIVGLRPVMKRKARQMAAKCKQVMAAQPEDRREAAGMPKCPPAEGCAGRRPGRGGRKHLTASTGRAWPG
jgi:hypothetical protein